MDKPSFQRSCPDCGRTFTVDSTYSDEAYQGHSAGDKNCVCSPCFADFAGLTIEELIGSQFDGEVDGTK